MLDNTYAMDYYKDTNPHKGPMTVSLEKENYQEQSKGNETLASSDILKDIENIAEVDAEISEMTGYELGSQKLTETSDQFILDTATQSLSAESIETALVAGALESTGMREATGTNPIQVLEIRGLSASINDVTSELHAHHATLPGGEEAALLISQEVDKLSMQLTKHWEYDDDKQLATNPVGRMNYSISTEEQLSHSGLMADKEISHAIGLRINTLWDVEQQKNATQRQAELTHLEGIIEAHGSIPAVENAKNTVQAQMAESTDPAYLVKRREVHDAAVQENIERDKQLLEEQIRQRVESDRYPWTMPDNKLPTYMKEGVVAVFENMSIASDEPSPDDIFRVPPPVKEFDNGMYSPDDRALLEKSGKVLELSGINFTRQELQAAGVFIVNRVGAGEQPLFGIPIPDSSSEGGIFNVQDRSFLTREEFDKVYAYQQEHGYGVGENDAADVQLDMLMFALRPDRRREDTRKTYGFGSREHKYGIARSPFVESGVIIKSGVEPTISDPALSGKRRINTLSLHLMNGHPDYPGLSEMFDPDKTDHDQKYMSAGEFVQNYYQPMTTEKEAFISIQNNIPTPREASWVSEVRTRTTV